MATQGKSKSIWRRFRRDPKYKVHRVAAVLVFVAVALGGASLFGRFMKNFRQTKDARIVADASLDSYQRVLQEGIPQEIVGFMNLMSDDPTISLPVRLENFNNKIALSDKLLEISDTKEDIRFATISKLETLIQILKVYHESNLATTAEVKRFERFRNQVKFDEDIEVEKSLAAASVFLALEKFRASKGKTDQVMNSLFVATKTDLEDFDLANQLVDHLSHFSALNIDIADYLKAMVSEYSSSENENIAKLMEKIEIAFFRRKYRIVPLRDAEKKFILESLESSWGLSTAVIAAMENEKFVDPAEIDKLLKSLTMILQSGTPDSVKKMFGQARDAFGKYQTGEQYEYFQQLDQIASTLQSKIDQPEFVTTDGKQLPVYDKNTSATLIFIVKDRIESRSSDLLEQFAKGFSGLIRDKLLSLHLVFVDSMDSDDDWQRIRTIGEQFSANQTVRVKEEQNGFIERISVPWSPCWLLLDDTGTLLEFNSLPSLLRSRMHKHVGPSR